jgi:hypothetical protein
MASGSDTSSENTIVNKSNSSVERVKNNIDFESKASEVSPTICSDLRRLQIDETSEMLICNISDTLLNELED